MTELSSMARSAGLGGLTRPVRLADHGRLRGGPLPSAAQVPGQGHPKAGCAPPPHDTPPHQPAFHLAQPPRLPHCDLIYARSMVDRVLLPLRFPRATTGLLPAPQAARRHGQDERRRQSLVRPLSARPHDREAAVRQQRSGACAHHAHVHAMALQLSAIMLQCPTTFDPPPPAV